MNAIRTSTWAIIGSPAYDLPDVDNISSMNGNPILVWNYFDVVKAYSSDSSFTSLWAEWKNISWKETYIHLFRTPDWIVFWVSNQNRIEYVQEPIVTEINNICSNVRQKVVWLIEWIEQSTWIFSKVKEKLWFFKDKVFNALHWSHLNRMQKQYGYSNTNK